MSLPSSFLKLIEESDLPVLVDFWAEWCGPCHAVAPVVKQIAGEYKGKLLVVKVDIDAKPNVAAHFQIQSIPTLMIFHRGRILARTSGALPYGALKNEVEKAMGELRMENGEWRMKN